MASLQINITFVGDTGGTLDYMFSEKLVAPIPENHVVELQYKRAPPGLPLPTDWTYMSSFYVDLNGDHSQTLPLNKEVLEGWTWRTRGVVNSLNLVSNEVEFVVGQPVSPSIPGSSLFLAVPIVVGAAIIIGYFFFVKK